MNLRIFTLLLSIFFFNTLSFAQSDAASSVVDPVSFEKARFNNISIGGKKWIKATIKARCKGNPDAKATGTDPDWLKNVELNLICAYEDNKKQMIWFSAPAKFHMLERNKEYYFSFYIPHEYVSMYNLKTDPSGYILELMANGKDYPLHLNNYKDRSNLTTKNIKSFMDAASSNSTANQGVMTYYEDAPFLVKYNDIPNGVVPTAMPKR